MERILFIDREQFGTLTDTLKYCEHLHDSYKIDYISFDRKEPKIKVPNVHSVYIPFIGPKVLRGLLLIFYSIIRCLFYNGFIYIVYFPKCSLIQKILFWKKMHVDVRTLSVSKFSNIREKENKNLNKEINVFSSVSFISEGIRNQLTLKKNIKTYILPLGADVISETNKDFSSLKLLYIGSLTNRDIIKTVIGVKQFRETYPTISLVYDIVGAGTEYNEIKDYINQAKLMDCIHLYGKIPYPQLKPFLDSHNIGVSFVPITDYFNFQPPTKTFEYALSGLYIIATKTEANERVVDENNGMLILDTAKDFSSAIYNIYQKRIFLDSKIIRGSMKPFLWKNIIDNYFKPIIENK